MTKKRISKVTGKEVVDYIDNVTFTEAVKKYVYENEEWLTLYGEQKQIPDEIGKGILQIVTKLGGRHNFAGYTYRDEMVDDAIVACVKAVSKFNPEKSNNAYGFMTQCAWYAMVNRLKSEKKQQEIKESMLLDPTFEFFESLGQNDNSLNVSKEKAIETFFQGKTR